MIHLERLPAPEELTEDLRKTLTEKYAQTGEKVWGQKFIHKQLLQMSYGKCCFCECKLTEESKYMEVEHFLYKDKYKEKVLEWENLLPACNVQYS